MSQDLLLIRNVRYLSALMGYHRTVIPPAVYSELQIRLDMYDLFKEHPPHGYLYASLLRSVKADQSKILKYMRPGLREPASNSMHVSRKLIARLWGLALLTQCMIPGTCPSFVSPAQWKNIQTRRAKGTLVQIVNLDYDYVTIRVPDIYDAVIYAVVIGGAKEKRVTTSLESRQRWWSSQITPEWKIGSKVSSRGTIDRNIHWKELAHTLATTRSEIRLPVLRVFFSRILEGCLSQETLVHLHKEGTGTSRAPIKITTPLDVCIKHAFERLGWH